MTQTTYRTGKVVKFPMWLIFSSNGDVRVTRREPRTLSRDERALFLEATLPLSLWETPVLRASLNVAEAEPGASARIDLTAASEALRGALGVDIDLQVREPEA
jgi:hypothetical protein